VNRNTVTGVLIGILLASLFFVLRTLTNTTVWSEDDLTRQYDIPVLGTIPALANVEKQGANAYVAGKE
jgi:capsular polysaccharide biosynthesis protein